MEQQNKINAYICGQLHSTITQNKDEGVTPMFITCDQCNGRATSKMYMVDQALQPTHEWFKPTEDEIKFEARKMAKYHHIPYDGIYNSLKEHARKGGLSLRKIKN